MKIESFNQLIDSINVNYIRGRHIEVVEPVHIEKFSEITDVLIYAHSGEIGYGRKTIAEGQLLFIPQGGKTTLKFGEGRRKRIKEANRGVFRDGFFKKTVYQNSRSSFTFISFEAKLFGSFNFFQTIDAQAFAMDQNDKVIGLIKNLVNERILEAPGYRKSLSIHTEMIFLEVMRYLYSSDLFQKQMENQRLYFNDSRLLSVFYYIKQNLNMDLSNSKLADIANVSEDYFGQLFKRVTGINAQEFVENQRLEKALELLRDTSKSINEIALNVGYADTPYFCRRFKLQYGLSANKMRKREADEILN